MERWKERKKEREGGGGWRNDPWIERVAILTWLHFRYDYYCAISGRVHGRTGRTRTNFQRERMKIDFHVSPNHPPFPLLSSFRTNAHRYVCQISIRNIDAIENFKFTSSCFPFFLFSFFLPFIIPLSTDDISPSDLRLIHFGKRPRRMIRRWKILFSTRCNFKWIFTKRRNLWIWFFDTNHHFYIHVLRINSFQFK